MLCTRLLVCFGLGWAVLLSPSSISRLAQGKEPPSTATAQRTVELFEAMDAGEIEAELIAPSARQIYLRVTNKTTDLLTIKLPKTFGAVPILAQFQPRGPGLGQGQPFGAGMGQGQLGQPGQFGQQAGGGGSQALGGGFGQGQVGNQGMGNVGNQFGNQMGNQGNQFGNANGGFFRVLPGRVGKVKAQTVCLEHGKPDPTSRHQYQIVPIDQLPQANRTIAEVCRLLGENLISQSVAQAAAWHVTDELSWPELAAKNRSESRYTGNVKYFNASELDSARLLLDQLERLTEPAPKSYASR